MFSLIFLIRAGNPFEEAEYELYELALKVFHMT